MQHSKDWREERRLRALELYRKGWLQKLIAEALGVTKGAVSHWVKAFKDLPDDEQYQAIRATKSTGRPREVTDEQRAQLIALVRQGALTFGFSGDVWTAARIKTVAQRELNIHVGLTSIKNLLHKEGFSVQKPQVKALQQEVDAIDQFRTDWVELKKNADDEQITVAFADEAGFYMLPSVVHTWSEVGQTPILHSPTKYEHLSVASAITRSGKLVTQTQARSFDGASIVLFLRHLLARLPGKIVLIWDGAKIHRSQAVKDFLCEGSASRLHLIRLPAYAPELNPDEGVWHWLKHHLGNICATSLQVLGTKLRKAIRDLQHRTRVLRSFFAMAGLQT